MLGLDHVQLAMPAGGDAEAIAFYEGLLGIPQVPKPAHLAARGGCWFERGELKVHLGVEPDFRPATKAHPALLVDDVRGLSAALAAAGHTVTDDEPLHGYDRVYATDPFGNRIELMQPTAEPPADEPPADEWSSLRAQLAPDDPPPRDAQPTDEPPTDEWSSLRSQLAPDDPPPPAAAVEVVSVSVTGPDEATLAAITHELVEARLVACGNIVPAIRSIYRWEGEVQDEAEATVLLHTRADHVPAVVEHVNAHHPYDTVQILATAITDADPAYRQWLIDATARREGAP